MAKYDLEERTFQFAKETSLFIRNLSNSIANIEYNKQLIRSSASVGAKYIDANESLDKKDFIMHLRISRKEEKESVYWLRLLSETHETILSDKCKKLIQEAIELKKIFLR